jgi:hypothetical protein
MNYAKLKEDLNTESLHSTDDLDRIWWQNTNYGRNKHFCCKTFRVRSFMADMKTMGMWRDFWFRNGKKKSTATLYKGYGDILKTLPKISNEKHVFRNYNLKLSLLLSTWTISVYRFNQSSTNISKRSLRSTFHDKFMFSRLPFFYGGLRLKRSLHRVRACARARARVCVCVCVCVYTVKFLTDWFSQTVVWTLHSLRPAQPSTFRFPKIRNDNMADTQTYEVGTKVAILNLEPWNGVWQ